MADTKLLIQEAQRTLNKINTKPTSLGIAYSIQKTKDKEKFLKEARGLKK